MVLTGKQFCVALLFQACSITHADATESKDYSKLVERGFAHLECAAYGMLTVNEHRQKFSQKAFVSGAFLLAEWLNDVESGKAKASVESVPKEIRLMPIPGPGSQFHLGYIWAQVEAEARWRTSAKSTGFFFNFGEAVDDLVRAEAEKQFQKSECELLN